MPHLAQSPTRHYMLNISFMGYDSDYTVIAKISRIFLREGLPHANTAPRTVKDTTPHHVTWEYHGRGTRSLPVSLGRHACRSVEE